MLVTSLMMIIITITSIISFVGIMGNIGWIVLENDPKKLNTKIGKFLFIMMYYLEVQEILLMMR